MTISSERFNQATEVVEAGIGAATLIFRVPREQRPQALEAHGILIDSLRDDDLSTEGLLELLGVALMICAYERTTGRSYRDA